MLEEGRAPWAVPQGRRDCSGEIVLQVRELNIFQLFQEPQMQMTISNISFLTFPLGHQQFQLFLLALLSKCLVLSEVESFTVLLDPSSNLWHSCWLSTSWPQLWPKRSTAAKSHSPLFSSVMGETSRLSWNKPYLFQPSLVLHSLCKIASKDAWACCIISLFINYVLTSAFKSSLVRSW